MMTGASPVLVPREDPVGKIIFAVMAISFGLVFFVALMTLVAAVMKGQTNRCRTILHETPYRALVVAVVGYGGLAGLAWFFYSRAFIRRLLETEIVPAMFGGFIVVIVVAAVVTFVGASGTFASVGDRLERLHGRPMSGLVKAALGTLVAVLAGWFPVVGWCFVIPLLLLFSFGSAVIALVPAIGRIGKGRSTAVSAAE